MSLTPKIRVGFVCSSLICLLSLCIAGCGRPTKPEVMARDVTDFKELYGQHCAGCHGAEGNKGAAQPMNDPLYLSLIPRDKLRQVIEKGSGRLMPAFAVSEGGALYPKQIDAVVNGIQKEWGRPVDSREQSLPPYSADLSSGQAAHGKQVFAEACQSCHSENGKSSSGSVTDASYLGLVSNQGLRTSTIVGRPDLGMADWRTVRKSSPLTNQEITDIVAYMASKRPDASEDGTNQTASNKGSKK